MPNEIEIDGENSALEDICQSAMLELAKAGAAERMTALSRIVWVTLTMTIEPARRGDALRLLVKQVADYEKAAVDNEAPKLRLIMPEDDR